MARKSDISDGVTLPINLRKSSGVICSEKLSTHAGSVENEKEDVMIIEDGTKSQDTPVGGASRGNMSVFQSKKETLAHASEDLVRKKCSDDDITVIKHIITSPRISLSDAKRIKRDVRKLYRERYKKLCAESSESGECTQSKVDSAATRLSSLSSGNSITAKADMGVPIQNEGQHRRNDTGISCNIYQNAVLSGNTTVLSAKNAKILTRSELSKVQNKPEVVLNTVRGLTNRETAGEDSSIELKNTENILLISEKNNTNSSTTVCESEMFQAASLYRRNKLTLPSADCEVSEGKVMHTENKKTGSCSVTNKNVMPVTTPSGLMAILPSGALECQVDRDPFENFASSKISLCVRRQHAFSSGHKMSLSRPMPLQKKNSNKDIIPGQTDSFMKRQCELSSEHSVVSPSQVCASVLPHGSTFETGNTLDNKRPPPPGAKVESIANKLHYYMAILCSGSDSKEKEPCHHLSDEGQHTGFTSTNTNILVQNKKVVSETGHDQSLSVSVACKESTSTTSRQAAHVSPLCSNGESKGKEIGLSPEVKRTKTSDSTARHHSVSVLHDLEVPVSLPGSLVPCVGNTPPTQKPNSAFLSSTAEQHYMEPAVTVRKLETTQPQPCTTSSIHTEPAVTIRKLGTAQLQSCTTSGSPVACKESTSTECEQIACGATLCSSVESKAKEICTSPESKRRKISDCTVRKSTESVPNKLEVPVSSCGSSAACVGSTDNTYKQTSTVLCNIAGEDVDRTVTVSELDVAQPQSQNFKLSREISQHPRKYSLINSFEILLAGHKTPQKKSPSKKLSKSSPINYVRNNRSPYKRMYGSTSANRALKFDGCHTEKKLGSLAEPENQSSVPELFFKKECVSYFEIIIAEVLEDKDMSLVLSEEDVKVVNRFRKLEYQEKKLYIRMLSRKYTWHRVSDIKYDDINVPAAFTELEISGLITSDYSSEELEVLLNMLKLTELRILCRTFRIPSAEPKPKLIQALLQYGRSQQTISGNQRGDSRAMIKSRVTETLGHCIKLCDKGRESCRRIVRLFSLPHQNDEEDRETSKQLILLHYVKTRRVEFPTYVILKARPIFSSRDDLLRFEEASELLTGLMNALSTKRWDEAQVYGQDARERFRALLEDSVVNDQVKSLPLFIRRYSAGSVYAYAMSKAVEAFKKRKDRLSECVIILQELLCQDVYLPHCRGKWYEELALILQVQLKNYEQAAATVIEAMKDGHLNEVHQQMLSHRGSLLLCKKGIGKNLKMKLSENIKEPLKKPPSVIINAKSMQINAPGRKQVYIQENACRQEITYSSVEEYAISHYKSAGYTEGIHDEGSTIRSLFGLIFWDIIYGHPVADVFRSSYQHEPLDLRSGEFYRHRKEKIDKRLENLCKWDMKYVQHFMEKMFKENQGKESVVNWQRLWNLQKIVGLINCIGVQVLSKILERLVKNYRAVCSGFPDLLVWNPHSSKYKFVEVKGPGDRLSVAQCMWLTYLTKCNANAEVCYVATTGAKKQKLKMGNVPDDEEEVCLSC